MNVIYCGYVVPRSMETEENWVHPSSNKMQTSILMELNRRSEIDELHVISILPIRPFPKSSKLFIKSERIELSEGITTKKVGFINIPIIKQLTIVFGVIHNLLKVYRRLDKKSNTVIYYFNMNLILSVPVHIVSRIIPIKKVCLIVDPINFPNSTNTLRGHISQLIFRFTNKLLRKNDGIVSFVENYINSFCPDVPHEIVEVGIELPGRQFDLKEFPRNNEKIILMFSGAIEEYNGIKHMIEIVKNLPSNYELHVFGGARGVGLTDYVIDESMRNNRIKYFGYQENSKVTGYQKLVHLLLNAKTAKDEHTSYLAEYAMSYKLVEYLGSCTPIVTNIYGSVSTKIIPFLNVIDLHDHVGSAESIIYLMSNERSWVEAQKRAIEGYRYIQTNMTWEIQVDKMIDLFLRIQN